MIYINKKNNKKVTILKKENDRVYFIIDGLEVSLPTSLWEEAYELV